MIEQILICKTLRDINSRLKLPQTEIIFSAACDMQTSSAIALHHPALKKPGIKHGFFTRMGGVSSGLYASLNGGNGSSDDPASIYENRCRIAAYLGVPHLVTCYQVHSPDVVPVTSPWGKADAPKADAMVTNLPGIALAAATADCGPVLFADAQAGIIGAAHAGWKGALGGVLEATVVAMEKIGAERSRIVAVLGPTISRNAYETGPEFVERFVNADASHARFFMPGSRKGHAMFDLPAFIRSRLENCGIGHFEDMALCTYSDETRFYSYRRSTHRGETDYGRLLHAIALVPE